MASEVKPVLRSLGVKQPTSKARPLPVNILHDGEAARLPSVKGVAVRGDANTTPRYVLKGKEECEVFSSGKAKERGHSIPVVRGCQQKLSASLIELKRPSVAGDNSPQRHRGGTERHRGLNGIQLSVVLCAISVVNYPVHTSD
jgi:hypothetical protein